jgi:putative membrane protein
MAVKLTLIGSFGAVILSVVLFPLFVLIVKWLYPLMQDYIGWLLIATCIFMILRDNKLLWAILVFLISGVFGVLTFAIPNLPDPLFPMLSGMFGISTLLISLNESQKIPEQNDEQGIKLRPWVTIQALLSGQFSGFITATMPGLGASTAAVISLQITRKLGDNGFMILMGSIGTVNFIMSMATLMVLDKARNGSIVAIQELMAVKPDAIMVFLATTLIAGAVSCFLVLMLGRFFSRAISRINYQKLVWGIISFIAILAVVMGGWMGFLILIISTAIGLIPAVVKVTRTHGMGCLILPVILNFI